MLVPISWVKDFVEITVPLSILASRLTMAGLEVEEIVYIGLPLAQAQQAGSQSDEIKLKVSGLSWEADKIVVASVSEVMPHPNADRLVLCSFTMVSVNTSC